MGFIHLTLNCMLGDIHHVPLTRFESCRGSAKPEPRLHPHPPYTGSLSHRAAHHRAVYDGDGQQVDWTYPRARGRWGHCVDRDGRRMDLALHNDHGTFSTSVVRFPRVGPYGVERRRFSRTLEYYGAFGCELGIGHVPWRTDGAGGARCDL